MHAVDVHPDGVGADGNLEQELVIEEEDTEQLLSTEALHDLDEILMITLDFNFLGLVKFLYNYSFFVFTFHHASSHL